MPHPKATSRKSTKRGRKRRQCPERNKLVLEQKCSEGREKKTENKSIPVEKTKINRKGETFCLVCEELYSESDPGETSLDVVCLLHIMGT